MATIVILDGTLAGLS